MADASFDVVSKVDRQEIDNALNQAGKELSQRFDFRGTNARISWAGEDGVLLEADTEERVTAALDVFKDKLIKRGISLKALDADEAAVYTLGVGATVPLTRAAAEAAVADQLADAGVRLDAWSARTDGAEVTVRCTRYVDIAFGWLFLGGDALERTATASARAPTS